MSSTVTQLNLPADQLFRLPEPVATTPSVVREERSFSFLRRLVVAVSRKFAMLINLLLTLVVLISFAPVAMFAWLVVSLDKLSLPSTETQHLLSKEEQQAWMSELEDFDRF